MMKGTKDFLKREKDLEKICTIVRKLAENKTGAAFAINGIWGSGKSFLLRMLEEKFGDEKENSDLKEGFVIFHYDCWKYNYYTEPVIPILSVLMEKIEELEHDGIEIPGVMKGAWSNLKTAIEDYGGRVLESKIGIDPIKFFRESESRGEELEAEKNVFDNHFSLKKALQDLRKSLSEVSENKTILFVVDELDRCLPEYTIKVLESIHHFFYDIDNVITILAIDRTELEYVIKKAYGEETDTDRYLKKIIDFYIPLDLGTLDVDYIYVFSDYIGKFQGSFEDLKWVKEMIWHIMEGLDIRSQEKIWIKAELLHNMIIDSSETAAMDYSCFAFEIMKVTEQYRWKQSLIEKANPSYTKFEMYIETFEKSLGTQLYISRGGSRYLALKEEISNLVFWYRANLQYEEKNGYCGNYYLENADRYRKNVEKMKEFMELSNIIE